MANPMIFQWIGESVDAALSAFVNTTAGTTASSIVATAVGLTTFYYVLLGYQMIAGRVAQPASQFFISVTKFLLISAFALNAENYLSWVVGSLRGLESGLAAAWSGSEVAPSSVYTVVDNALGKGWGIAGDLWEQAANRSWDEIGMSMGEYFNSVLIAVATLIVALPAGAMIVVAKAALTLLFGIGPFFIMALMYPVTAKWFDSWLGQVLTNIFSIALLAACLSFAVKIFEVFVTTVDLNSEQNPLFTSLQIVTLAIVLMYLLRRANDIGAALAGGVSSSAITFGQMTAGAIGGLTAPGRTMAGVARTINPQSTRLDPTTGFQTTSSRMEHAAMGRTLANPAYRQGLRNKMESSWGKAPGGSVSGNSRSGTVSSRQSGGGGDSGGSGSSSSGSSGSRYAGSSSGFSAGSGSGGSSSGGSTSGLGSEASGTTSDSAHARGYGRQESDDRSGYGFYKGRSSSNTNT